MDIKAYEKQLKIVTDLKEVLPQLESALIQQIEALRNRENLTQSIGRFNQLAVQLQLDSLATPRTLRGRRRRSRTTKTTIFDEILTEVGKPQHVTTLAQLAEARGLKFIGKKPKPQQVRDILFASSKRFHNFGNNNWGLVEWINRVNGYEREQPELVEVR